MPREEGKREYFHCRGVEEAGEISHKSGIMIEQLCWTVMLGQIRWSIKEKKKRLPSDFAFFFNTGHSSLLFFNSTGYFALKLKMRESVYTQTAQIMNQK